MLLNKIAKQLLFISWMPKLCAILQWCIRELKMKVVLYLKKKYGDQIGIPGDFFKKYGRQKATYKKTKLGALINDGG